MILIFLSKGIDTLKIIILMEDDFGFSLVTGGNTGLYSLLKYFVLFPSRKETVGLLYIFQDSK